MPCFQKCNPDGKWSLPVYMNYGTNSALNAVPHTCLIQVSGTVRDLHFHVEYWRSAMLLSGSTGDLSDL